MSSSNLENDLNQIWIRAEAPMVVIVLNDKIASGNIGERIVKMKLEKIERTNHSNIRQQIVKPVVVAANDPSAQEVAKLVQEAVSQKVQLKTEFDVITGGALDEQTVCALVDGKEVRTKVDVKKQQIEILSSRRTNSTIEFFYCANSKSGLPNSKYATMRIDNRCNSLRKHLRAK